MIEGSNLGKGRIFSLSSNPRPGFLQWISGSHSLGLKHPKSEADNQFPFTEEVKSEWSYTSTPRTCHYDL
jgi:hypothetical protein